MKKVLILFKEKKWEEDTDIKKSDYQYSYELMSAIFLKNNIKLYRASYEWFNMEKSIFLFTWTFENNKWTRCYNIKPDIIFDKTPLRLKFNNILQNLSEIFPFINPIEFASLVANKRFLPFLVSPYIKKQINISNKKNIENIKLLNSEKVVIKPASLNRGTGVKILSKKTAFKLISDSQNPYSYVVQEFIDSKNGIPNIMKGVHDLRVIMLNKKIIHTYYRKPPKNSLLANISLGGSKEFLDIKLLPQSVLEIIDYVNNIFSSFKNIHYSIDLMFDENKKPWIIEFNAHPGMLFKPKDENIAIKVYKDLASLFS